jgi:hypothetical protein
LVMDSCSRSEGHVFAEARTVASCVLAIVMANAA